MTSLLPSRFAVRILSALAALAAVSHARAQVAQGTLEQFVVSASRTPQALKYTPSSVSVLPLADLAAAQISDWRAALAAQPGVIVSGSGATGAQTSVFLRGSNSHQTLFIVDGVRMNDRSAAYFNFLGGADLAGVDRVEVLRGPQSPLYGSSAMGGVILVDTTRGCGPLSGGAAVTAGTFDSWGAAAALQGGTRTLGYSASIGHAETDNDRPGNAYRQTSYSARTEWLATPALLFGATFRGQEGDGKEPGSRTFPSPGAVDSSNYLTTVYAQAKASEEFTSRLTLAQHRRAYIFTSLGRFASVSALKNRREILDWQNTWAPTKTAEIVAGANFERSRYTIDGRPSKDDVAAGYLAATVRPTAAITLTGGLRHDEFNSVGGATTWRSGVAWLPRAGTKLRATYGTGFSAPGSDDRYGVVQWGQLANPNLEPEKSRGWDVGLDQELPGGVAAIGVTYFQNRFRNLFEWETVNFTTFEGRTVNRARATTEGVEVAATGKFGAATRARLAYTYLEARNSVTQARLTRRPRHTTDAEVQFQATKVLLIGAGVHGVSDRRNGAAVMEDYTTARVFASYAVNDRLRLKLRAENALDEAYEEVFGYPALPRAVHGSIEWRF